MTTKPIFASGAAVAFGLMGMVLAPERAAATTILLSAESFAVLGASTVTNAGATAINGNLGLFPGTDIADAGTLGVTGTTHNSDAVAEQAQIDATAAYDILSGLSPAFDLTDDDLGGLTLAPGVYNFDTSAQLTGTLILDFGGASNADFVFQIGSSLTTASDSAIVILNGHSNNGVFFQVGTTATLGANTAFSGNILALNSVVFDSTAQILCGRAIGLTAAVTMIGNTISNDCFGSGVDDFGSVGFSGGDFVSLGYTGGGFDGIPFRLDTSVPEPSTLALFGGGLLGFLAFAGRRRRPLSAR